MTSRGVRFALWLALCAGSHACAGDLERPERFDGVLAALDGSVSGTGGAGPSPTDASPPPSEGGPIPDAGPPANAPPACVTDLFESSCGTVGCHNRGAPQVDLVSDGVTGRLLDQSSSSALCRGRTYVSSDGSESLLLDKLLAVPPCGSRMPLVGALTSEQQTCLGQWVDSLGAAP
jgi:hypothetical protein